MSEVVCYCGTGYDGHIPSHPMHPRGDPAYRLMQREAKCKGCGARIAWWETPAGKPSPHDYDGTSHFGTCPLQARFRADKEARQGREHEHDWRAYGGAPAGLLGQAWCRSCGMRRDD